MNPAPPVIRYLTQIPPGHRRPIEDRIGERVPGKDPQAMLGLGWFLSKLTRFVQDSHFAACPEWDRARAFARQ